MLLPHKPNLCWESADGARGGWAVCRRDPLDADGPRPALWAAQAPRQLLQRPIIAEGSDQRLEIEFNDLWARARSLQCFEVPLAY